MIQLTKHAGAITLRKLPPPVARAVRERAARDRVSLNKAVIRLLEEALGLAPATRARVHTDLDDLIGSWSESEARDMERFLASERRVDPELWR